MPRSRGARRALTRADPSGILGPHMATTNPATNLLELTPAEIGSLVEGWGEPGFRGRQVAAWVYERGVRDFGGMTDLAKPFRARLAAFGPRWTADGISFHRSPEIDWH